MIGLLKEVNIPSEEREEYVINLMATGLNKTLSLEIIQQYEKTIAKSVRKELLYNYSLVLFDCKEYKRAIEYLNDFEKQLDQEKDKEDVFAVRLFRDFMEWNSNKTIEKGVIDIYERMLETASSSNVRGVIQNNLLFYRQGQQITENTH